MAEKKGKGRPTKFNDELAALILRLTEQGMTNDEVAKAIGIAPSTLKLWKATHEDFSAAIKEKKEVADDLVAASLYRRATGYSCPEVKTFYDKDIGKVVTKTVMKHYPPSEVACIFWLKNRRPDAWRDKQEIDLNSEIKISIDGDESAL